MKLSELKPLVYEMAGVTTTSQLKTKYPDIRSLDMRRKASWEQALAIVQPHQQDFSQWLENPPEEYKELFSEIATVAADYTTKLAETKQLSQEMIALADNLQEMAEENQTEADRLKQEVQLAKQIAKQADLN